MNTNYRHDPTSQQPGAGSYGEYLDGLLDEMARRPSLCQLVYYLRHYGRQRGLLPYTARDAKAPDVKAIFARGFDDEREQRLWDTREHARAIIEGREPWPRRLVAWKVISELRYYHGTPRGQRPAWLDPKNWPDPTREPEYREPRRERTRMPLTGLKAKVAARRRERRKQRAAR